MVDRKNGNRPDQSALAIQIGQNNTPTPLGSETPNEKSGTSTATNSNGYYNTELGGSTPYPPLGFNDQAGNGGPADPSQQNGTGGAAFDPTVGAQFQIYTSSGPGSAANLATPTLPSNATPGIDQTGTPATNPLIAFASQATQHVINAGPEGQQSGAGQEEEWRRSNAVQAQAHQLLAATAHATGIVGGNPWHDWTAAIAHSQERYSANALLTLGGGSGGRPGDHVEGGVGQSDALSAAAVGLGIGIGVSSTHAGQWPLLLFLDGTGNGGGGG